MRPVARVLILVSFAALLLGSGCSSDADLAEASFSAEHGDARARVWIPINEPRSVGTYRAEVRWGDGATDRTEAERDGMISAVWLADVANGSAPELVVATSSSGSGTYGSVHVYARGNGGLRQVELSALDVGPTSGYMGHDVFSVEGGRLCRSHPIYEEGDPNSAPSGGETRFWYSFADSAWVPVEEAAAGDAGR